MRPLTIYFLSFATLVSAVTAAVYWFKSALVRSEEFEEPIASITDAPEQHIQATQFYASCIHQMLNESSRLNKHAAIWTGISAVLGALTSVYGAL